MTPTLLECVMNVFYLLMRDSFHSFVIDFGSFGTYWFIMDKIYWFIMDKIYCFIMDKIYWFIMNKIYCFIMDKIY